MPAIPGDSCCMKRNFRPTTRPWLWLAWLVCLQGLCAQNPGFRTPPKQPPQPLSPPTQANIVNQIIYYQQAERVAALADDDPLLAAVYLAGAEGLSREFTFIERDMIRRGDVSKTMLLKMFKSSTRDGTRACMIHWIRDNSWIDPEAFLPAVRSWYQESKRAGDPNYVQTEIRDFLTVWGYPEDELILTEIGAHGLTMRLFQKRLQRIRNGDTKSNPNLPPGFDYRNKTLDQLKAAVSLPGPPPKSAPTSGSSPAAVKTK